MSEERQADTDDAGRGRDEGQGGYAEEQPGGSQAEGAGDNERGAGDHSDSPTQSDGDSGPGTATGNPGAAG